VAYLSVQVAKAIRVIEMQGLGHSVEQSIEGLREIRDRWSRE